jgi:hypothetical protein
VLRPVLVRGLPFWATGVTCMVLRVDYLALTAKFVYNSLALILLQALPLNKIYKRNLYHGHIFDFERKTVLHVRLKPKNTRVACRDTPDTNEARGLKKR